MSSGSLFAVFAVLVAVAFVLTVLARNWQIVPVIRRLIRDLSAY